MVKDAYLKSQASLFHDLGYKGTLGRQELRALLTATSLEAIGETIMKNVFPVREQEPPSPGDVQVQIVLAERRLEQIVQNREPHPVASRSIDHILLRPCLDKPLGPGNVRIAVADGWMPDPGKLATLSSLAQRHGQKAAAAIKAARPRPCARLCLPGEEPCRSSCSRCLHPAHKGGPCELCPPRTNRAFCSAFCWRCRHAGTDAEHKATGCGRCPAGDACHSAKLVPADAPADSSVGADLPMASPCRSPAGCSPGRSCSPSGCSDGSADPTSRSPRRCSSGSGGSSGSRDSEPELADEDFELEGEEASDQIGEVDDAEEPRSGSKAETESSDDEDDAV
ncbi:hypothetical protein T492DRAFT_936511 [Pavlovales sp. CCMP2436]|nr:hypothetical protein T492DRAFT_936511 [Pavlovales sp. CCMP2436]